VPNANSSIPRACAHSPREKFPVNTAWFPIAGSSKTIPPGLTVVTHRRHLGVIRARECAGIIMTKRIGLVTATILLGAGSALAQPAPGEPAPPADPANPPPTDTTPTAPPTVAPPIAPIVTDKPIEKKPSGGSLASKLDITFYGFVEMDSIYDSTQGLSDLAGNAGIARPNTYTGDHPQMTFGARNSRFGLKLAAPEYSGVKVSGMMEMDFLGTQGTGSEAAFWQNPVMRFRHYNVKLETKIVDLMFGQYWQLFGWQGMNQPNTVQIQGIPGEIYSRAPQVRISKKIPIGDVASVEVAVAASRPVSRASATPDAQSGLKLSFDHWKAWHTGGSTGSALDSAAIGVSMVSRRLAVNEFSSTPFTEVVKNGFGVSVDALLPIISATKESKANALTLQGSYVNGHGIADLYTGLSGGVSNPALPNPSMANPAPTYTPNIDNGLVMWYQDAGTGTFSLHPIQWTSYLAGLQYYLPPSGKVWLSANYSHLESGNAHLYGKATSVWDKQDWFDGNLMFDATPFARFGVEFSRTQQTYVDKVEADDNRFQFSAFLLF
jgi:hypothetical protein